MTLSEFTENILTRNDRMIVICDCDDYDDMFDIIDDLNEGKKKIQDIKDFIQFVYCPFYCPFKDSYYLDKKWAEAEARQFYIGDCFIIIWVQRKEKLNDTTRNKIKGI